MLIYISHPYRNNPHINIQKVRLIICKLREKYPQHKFFAPHLYLFHIVNEEYERDIAMEWCLEFLSKCDQMWICGEESDGVKIEINFCNENNITMIKEGNIKK